MPVLFSRRVVCSGAFMALVVFATGQPLAYAQTAKPISVGQTSTLVPSKLGGLMLSPIQRQNLEYVRSTGRSLPGVEQNTDQLLKPAVGLSETLTISGVVIRSGNRSTVWVNDQPLYGQGGSSALRTQAQRVGVLQPGSRHLQAQAKPGQTVDVQTQQATDLLPPGAIKIIPPKAGTTAKDKQEK